MSESQESLPSKPHWKERIKAKWPFLSVLPRMLNHPRYALLSKIILLKMAFVFSFTTTMTALYFKQKFSYVGSEHAAIHGQEVHSSEEPHEEHGEGPSLMGERSPFPDEVVEAQDGIEEEGHDLKDPEPKRDLASLMTEKKDLGENVYRFFDLDQIFASTSETHSDSPGSIAVNITLEMSSAASLNEVKRKKIEINNLVISLIATKPKSLFRTGEGLSKFKKEIQREVNHMMMDGKVTDVLVTELVIK